MVSNSCQFFGIGNSARAGSPIHHLRSAPEPDEGRRESGRTVRFLGDRASTLWEAAADGTGLHRLLRNWNSGAGSSDCDDTGNWIARGKYFLFRSVRGHGTSIWAMQETPRFLGLVDRRPLQIYPTSNDFYWLAPSPDGKRTSSFPAKSVGNSFGMMPGAASLCSSYPAWRRDRFAFRERWGLDSVPTLSDRHAVAKPSGR